MKSLISHVVLLAVLMVGGFSTAQAQYLNQIGMTLLSAVTTNLNGSGIRVAQPEASGDYLAWQVNPANVGQPASLFTYISSNGTAATFPNSLGSDSGHADTVANQFYGIPNGVATNVTHVDSFEANDFLDNYVFPTLTHSITDSVVNQSFTFGEVTVSEQQQFDTAFDNYSAKYRTLFASPANNYGTTGYNTTNVVPPGTAYDCICVGAYLNGTSHNGLGPTLDNGRCKPDITALSGETSYSTPQVAGAAAVLMQAGLRGDGGSDTNSAFDLRTIKALLLNGAVKPSDWTNMAPSPLDYRYGAGVVNVFNSYEQLAGGKQGYVASVGVAAGSAHPPTGATGSIGVLNGWDFNTNTSSASQDKVNHYYFDVTNSLPGAVFVATATLVWNRQQNQSGINNLELFLYDCANSNLVAGSTSLVDNVQHVFVPRLPPGRYDLQVWKAGGPGMVSKAEPYALAFAFTTTALSIALDGTNAMLMWPAYPAGFQVEATTNLSPPVWSNGLLPAPVFTNGQNMLVVSPTHAAQFFRLGPIF